MGQGKVHSDFTSTSLIALTLFTSSLLLLRPHSSRTITECYFFLLSHILIIRCSLLASIHSAVPKLLSQQQIMEATTPIPTDPPTHILERFSSGTSILHLFHNAVCFCIYSFHIYIRLMQTTDIPGFGAPMMAAHPPKYFSPDRWYDFYCILL